MPKKYFIGIDIGGTKIAAGLVKEPGQIISRLKEPTPKNASEKQILALVYKIIQTLLLENELKANAIVGIGIGVPGIVEESTGKVLITPNINLSGCELKAEIEQKFKIKTAVGNDVNVGLLGEQWFGAAKEAQSVIGIFPGTGVGGAIVINGKLISGVHGAAAEIGHMIVAVDGPECTCGNRGCLEAIAGRWAIERDIRRAIKKGKKTIITKLLDGKSAVMKSKYLKEALDKNDQVVTKIMKRAAQSLGSACVSLRHIFDPDVIVFGGGVIEACASFMLPIIKEVVAADPFFKKIGSCRIVESQLEDDAIILGGVALSKQALGLKLMKGDIYPKIQVDRRGQLKIDQKLFKEDLLVRADGKLKPQKFDQLKKLELKTLKKLCKKKPAVLFVALGSKRSFKLSGEAKDYLERKAIELDVLPLVRATELYNQTERRKAGLFLF